MSDHDPRSDRDEHRLADRIRRTINELAVGWWLLAAGLGGFVAFVLWVYTPWVVFGLFTYYVARPIDATLQRRLRSPGLSAAVTLVLVVGPILALLLVVALVAIGQLASIVTADAIVDLLENLGLDAVELPTAPADVVRAVLDAVQQGAVQELLGSLSRTVGSAAATLYNLFLALLFAFVLLREDELFAGWFHRYVADEGTDVGQYLHAVDAGLRSVYFGYTLTIFVVMLLAAVLYTLFNLVAPPGLAIPSVVLLAVVTGVFTIIPLLGRTIVYVAIAAWMVVRALPENPTALWFPLLFLAVMELPFDNLIRTYIRPVLSGGLFRTSAVMFAYLLGPSLFGWYGIFLGPFVMVVVLVFVRWKMPQLLHPDREPPPVPGSDAAGGRAAGDTGSPPTENTQDGDDVGGAGDTEDGDDAGGAGDTEDEDAA